MRRIVFSWVGILFFYFALTLFFLFPITQGLVLLPLDLLATRFSPWTYYFTGTILTKNTYMQDSIAQMYPWKQLVYESFAKHLIPFWNPYQFLGMPFMAGMKPTVFYPLSIFYFLGNVGAWNTLMFAQIFLSLIFSYFFARSLGFNKFISIFVSFVYSLNALMITTLEFGSEGHVLLWFPLIFLAIKEYVDKPRGIFLLLLGASLTCCIFAGQIQFVAYLMLLLLAFIFFYARHKKAPFVSSIYLLLAIGLGFASTAVQMGPALELFSSSFRNNTTSQLFISGLFEPYHFILFFAPEAFGSSITSLATPLFHGNNVYFGIIPLFFVVYALLFARRNFFVTFFGATVLLSLLFLWKPVGTLFYLAKFPLLTSGSGDREMSIFFLAVSVLAGFGLLEFIKTEHIKRKVVSVLLYFCTFLLIVFLFVIANKTFAPNIFIVQSIFYPSIFIASFTILALAFLSTKKSHVFRTAFLLLIFCVVLFDFYRFLYRYTTFSNTKFMYPVTPTIAYVQQNTARNLERVYGLTDHEIPTVLHVYSPEVYNPLYPERTGRLLNALQKLPPEKLPDNKYFLTHSPALQNALNVLGVQLIAVDKNSNLSTKYFNTPTYANVYTKLFEDDRYAIYNNSEAYKRFGLYYKTRIIPDDKQMLTALSQGSVNLKDTVLLEENLPEQLSQGTGSATLVSSNVNTQQFSIVSSTPALFYISDTFYPGWSATINGKPTKIYRANYNLRAVLVPGGASILAFQYVPTHFALYTVVSLISLFGLIFLSMSHRIFVQRK